MLYIMRHGKTEWNSLHKLQGRTDIPLNDEGRLMALNACTALWLNRVARFFFLCLLYRTNTLSYPTTAYLRGL